MPGSFTCDRDSTSGPLDPDSERIAALQHSVHADEYSSNMPLPAIHIGRAALPQAGTAGAVYGRALAACSAIIAARTAASGDVIGP
jgi:hypothetical protein